MDKDTCSHSLIYTTNRVIIELQNSIMLINCYIKFLQITNYSNLLNSLNSYPTLPELKTNFIPVRVRVGIYSLFVMGMSIENGFHRTKERRLP